MGFITESLGPKPYPRAAGENAWVESAIRLMQRTVGFDRPTKRYIAQSGSGNDTGGTGNGLTPNTPFLVRHLADLRTLMANNSLVPQTPNVQVLLRSGDIFRPDTTNDTTINNSWLTFPAQPNWTLATYDREYTVGTGDNGRQRRSAMLLGSIQLGAGGWSAGTSINAAYTTLFFRATTLCYHVWYSHLDPVDGRAYGLSPETFRWYGRFATGASLTAALDAMQAADQDAAVYDTTNGRLIVKFRSARATASTNAILEAAVARNAGVELGQADNHCIRDIAAVGFGMNSDTGVSQRYCIHVVCDGTKKAVVENCVAAYSGHHAIGHLQTSGGGGSVLFHNCVIGFCQGDQAGTGSSTPHVSYSNNGGHEGIVSYCRFPFGNLRSLNAGGNTSGTTLTEGSVRGHCNMIYGHSGAAGGPFDLLIGYRCVVEEDAVTRGGSTVFLGSGEARGVNPRPDHESETTWQRCAFIECSIPDGPFSFASGLGIDCCYSGCDINLSTLPDNSLFFHSQADTAGTANVNSILFVGSRISFSTRRLFTSAIETDRFLNCFSVGNNNTLTNVFIGFVHCDIVIDARANHFVELFSRFRTDRQARSFLLNTALSIVHQRDESTAQAMAGLFNRDVAPGGTGGMRGCAFFGIRETTTTGLLGYDTSGSPTTLRSPFGPSTLVPAAEPHLSWLRPQINLYGDQVPMTVVGPYGDNFPSRPSTRYRTISRPSSPPYARS